MSRTRLVVRNVLATIATQLISWVISFVVTLYLPRYLGDEGMGKFAFANSFVMLFSVFATLGMSAFMVREIARNTNRISDLLPGVLLIQFVVSSLLSLAAYIIACFLGYPELTRTLIAIAAGAMIINTLNNALGSALQGLENIPRQSFGLLVDKFLSSALILFLVFTRAPLWALGSVAVITSLVTLAVNLAAFKEWLPKLQMPTKETVRFLLAMGMPFFGVTVFRTLYSEVDTTILSMLTNDQTVGWYALSVRLLGTTLFIPVALAAALLPTLTKLYQEDTFRFFTIIQRMVVFVFLLAILIGLPIAVLSRIILLDILRYPTSFTNASVVLSIYGVGCVFWYLTQILGTAMSVLDRQKEMCRIAMYSLILMVVGCLVLIPLANRLFGNGAIGSALVRVGVEAFITVSFLCYLPKGLFDRATILKLLKVGLAAALFVGALLIDINIWLRIGMGIAVFLIACRQFGCIDGQDVDLVKQIIRNRRGG